MRKLQALTAVAVLLVGACSSLSVPMNEPLHSAAVCASSASLPVTDDVSQRLVRLPLHAALSMADADRVVVALLAALEKRW